jgi:hypothetical protein
MIDGLIPYLLAGVAQNERCIWVESSALPISEIGQRISKHPELEDALACGQLKVWGAAEWYGEPSALNSDEVIQRLLKEEVQALAKGFHGLRITGNCGFVSSDHWQRFMEYEEKLHSQLKDRRIVACCNYHRQQCRPVDILDVVRRHHGALDHSGDHWQVFLQQPNFDALIPLHHSESY